jgi:amino acid adenylation domain-containing protein
MFDRDRSVGKVSGLDNLNYWKKQLQGVPPVLDLTTDGRRALGANKQTATESLMISHDLTQALQEIHQLERTSLSIILLASWQVLLYRYTQQENILVGLLTPECGVWQALALNAREPVTSINRARDYKERAPRQLLPIVCQCTEKLSWRDFLNQVQQKVIEAENYGKIELGQLEQLLAERQGNQDSFSLAQILFQYQNANQPADLFLPEALKQKLTNKDLFLDVVEQTDFLICSFEYAQNLFKPATIKRLAAHYQRLLAAIVANPDEQIDRLQLLTKSEEEQALFGWNQTPAALDPSCIHQMLAETAEQNPDAVAIVHQQERLTYGELNSQANQVAHYLQSLGVKPESLVGLFFERSLSMVVGLFGILKAGGAYVPLDLVNPKERQAFILQDSQLSILLTQEHLLEQVPEQITKAICLDRDWPTIAKQPTHNPTSQVTQANIAQIVYTSGSTGKPKGVMLTHGNVSHYAQDLQRVFKIAPTDVYLHRGSIALVVSARQLLAPLALGATVVITTEAQKRDAIRLLELIKEEGVTIVDHVPSFWRHCEQILNQLEPQTRANLLDNQVRLVAAGGEQVTTEILACWRNLFKPGVWFANIYGQTEGTGVVTVYLIPSDFGDRLKAIPVGSPIPNMKVYLLDRYLKPVPIGVPAELHISGAGVASGYLNRPELTAEKFIPNPYVPGDRLYKTGDLARYLPDGTIQFLGRIDRQVNLYGLRLELGEIEAILSQHPLVQETVVVVDENDVGQTLVAYVIPAATETPRVKDLRGFLKEQLPDYMVPSNFIFLDTFPLTTSGKIDRQALLKCESTQPNDPGYVAPRNQLEAELTQILARILNLKSIGIFDNFLELGGNSLLAAKLVSEIEQKYQQKLQISAVFQAPTVAELAALLRQERSLELPQSLIPIQVGVERPNLFCIHILGHGLEYYRPLANYLGAEVNLYGLSTEFINGDNLPHPRDIKALASYYYQDLLKFQPQGPYLLVGVSFGGVIAYEIAQKLVAGGYQVSFLGLFDSYCPYGDRWEKPWTERLASHLHNLRQKKLTYLAERMQDWYYVFRDYFLYKVYRAKKGQEYFEGNLAEVEEKGEVYERLRHMELKREHSQVNQDYQIEPYPGRVTLFRATANRDLKLEWQQLAGEGLEIFDIPGTHLGIYQEPEVQVLAEKLKFCLRQII